MDGHGLTRTDTDRHGGRGGAWRAGTTLKRSCLRVPPGLWVVLAVALSVGAWGEEGAPLTFNKDVRPILSDKCFLCHGPDKNQRKADLRLDVAASAFAVRDGRVAIAAGKPEASELVRRISSGDPEEQMPPPDSGRSLNEREKATLAEWVRQGAEYQPHWAYILPARPELPAVQHAEWPRNPIDHFVLARLEREGIEASPEADPVSLLRRLSFDLLGLPPDELEVSTFLTDTSPGAYERLVDRLLASPHFGERMAVGWLDLVRYADTNGYHGDEHRSVWPYRDYVINAFNTNKSYDQFTREQLGGDLMPDATRDQKVAATYNRLNQLTAEGGAQAKEYLAKYAADRVRTFAGTWLGATMGCAECHDHKFDPFTMRDFYSLEAFFADIQERGVYGAGERWDPLLMLPTEEQTRELTQLDQEMAQLQTALDAPTESLAAAQAPWEQAILKELAGESSAWSNVQPKTVCSANGATLTVLEDASVLASGANPEREIYDVMLPAAAGATALRLEALQHASLGDGLSRGNGNFVLTEVEVTAGGAPVALVRAAADYEQEKFPISAAIDGKADTGWAVDGHTKRGAGHQAVFAFDKPLEAPGEEALRVRLHFESGFAQHAIGCFRISLTREVKPELPAAQRLPQEVIGALQAAPDTRAAEQREALAKYYRTIAPELDSVRAALETKRQRKQQVEQDIPFTLATVSVEPREIRLLPRGNWLDESGEPMQPAAPAFLTTAPEQGRRTNRLDLAEWVVSPDNPLTARVFVNRLWAHRNSWTGWRWNSRRAAGTSSTW
ncbi:MAG: DUF1549 domain-containing protein [Candidatus Hydrogenedentes bacterium]|nr:DUF1549 domain-containing protein [Candidatus Hydrogenedentota bacterium]